ncbi:MAG: CcmD family protein [Bacteroidota bacterium]|nr:CcmD family protein [Bacteroidota bacterium]MDX5428423.1 CcmD family protein [Bacteroidota bacterium]MDX5447059.1 CcmD family protein [Bacteroidota bacterium]MDX5506190.1 CcmD family protein [Bacteroidota bacterium]
MRNAITLLLLTLSTSLLAQRPVEMADTMRDNGKIYVVVLVLSIVLAGMFIYLWTIDRKVTRLENKKNEE